MYNKYTKRAFTLVELLVVISIIALLLSILMPSLSRARIQARVLTCAANSKQLGTLMVICQADNGGVMPVVVNRNTYFFVPAKASFLSLALKSYVSFRKPLSQATGDLDPDKVGWSVENIRSEEHTSELQSQF